MGVYTETFLRGGPVAGTYSWNVPDDHRAVITCVMYVNGAGAAGNAWVKLEGNWLHVSGSLASGAGKEATMRVVAYANEQLQCAGSAAGFMVYVSGYLFEDTGAALLKPMASQIHELEPYVTPGAAPGA